MRFNLLIIVSAAHITLIPLDDSKEFTRVFAINPTTDHIKVGRASKNESKGFVAARNNAWFDSPIISRHHAQFKTSPASQVCVVPKPSLVRTF